MLWGAAIVVWLLLPGVGVAQIAVAPTNPVAEEPEPQEPEEEEEQRVANPGQAYVAQIRFEGNDELSGGDLRDHMLTQSPPWYRFWDRLPFYEDEIREDMKRLVALYRQHGHYEAQASYELIRSEEGPGVTIEITIDEGKAVRLEHLIIRLADGADPATHPLFDARKWQRLIRRVPVRPGRKFRLGEYQATRKGILAWVAERGFPNAQLEGSAEVDLPTRKARVEWTLLLGPRVRLGEVGIEGLEDVGKYIVEREIRLEPGEWYSLTAMAKTRRRVQNLGLFRWTIVEALPPVPETTPPITPESEAEPDTTAEASQAAEGVATKAPDDSPEPRPPEPPEEETAPADETWPVSIRVAERRPRRVRIGGGWGTDTSFRGELSWHHRNFYGGARHMDVSVRYSGLGASFRPSFMEPYLFGTRTRLIVSPAIVYEVQDAYTARRILADVQLQRELFEHFQIRVGYRFNRDDIFSVLDNPGEDDLPEGVSITTGPNIELSRSTVDNRLNARSGTSIELEAESSISAFGSDEDFVRYTLDARGFLEVIDTVLALRALLGTIQNHGNTDEEDIPLVERFYSGGSNSMRGFGYRSLSPEDANGDSIGGSSLVEGSFEWRIPIWGPLGVVGFLDAAQVDPDPWQFRIDDLLYAAGTGLRFTTPAGPLRVDFAWRLNPPRKRGKFRISASLGHTF